MISADNYFQRIDKIGVNRLPDTLRKSHEFVVKSTNNGTSWEMYQSNATIKKVIDLYFEKLEQYLKTQGDTQPQKKSSSGENENEPESVFQIAFRLLTKFIPGFQQHLKTGKKSGVLEIKKGNSVRQINCFMDARDSDIVLIDAINNKQEAQFDVSVYPAKEEAHVTSNWISFYYEDKYGLDEDARKDEEEGADIGEPLTSSMVEWLEDLLNEGYQMEIKKSTKATSVTPKKKATNKTVKKTETVRSKKVEHIREEVKFIKRYVALHNRIKSPASILSFIKSLQRSIVQKLIRKTSPLANEIRAVQEKLVDLYNSMKGELRIELKEKDLNRLVKIAGGEQVYPSIGIMKRYIGMQGKQIDSDKIALFHNAIEKALKSDRVKADDPYRDKVQAIFNTVKKLKTGSTVNIAKAELNGLEGILKGCGCKTNSLGKIYHTGEKSLRRCNKKTYTDSTRKGACSYNKGLSGVLTAEEMANRTFEKLKLDYRYRALIGEPAKNFTMMLHGEPNAGKTTFLLKFAKYLAENFGRVLYISSEEFDASTMTDKVKELISPFPPTLYFYANLIDVDVSDYDFVILDSVNDLGLTLPDFKALRKENFDTAFILVLQHTKDGTYRGGKDWEHEVEIAGEIVNGIVTIYRNRYGVKGTLSIFENPTNSYQPNYVKLKQY